MNEKFFSDTGGSEEKFREYSQQEWNLWPSDSSPDALPLSHRRLVGAKATKLDSCDKHSDNQTQPTLEMTPGFKPFTSCILLVVYLCACAMSEKDVMVNFKYDGYVKKLSPQSVTQAGRKMIRKLPTGVEINEYYLT